MPRKRVANICFPIVVPLRVCRTLSHYCRRHNFARRRRPGQNSPFKSRLRARCYIFFQRTCRSMRRRACVCVLPYVERASAQTQTLEYSIITHRAPRPPKQTRARTSQPAAHTCAQGSLYGARRRDQLFVFSFAGARARDGFQRTRHTAPSARVCVCVQCAHMHLKAEINADDSTPYYLWSSGSRDEHTKLSTRNICCSVFTLVINTCREGFRK